MGGELGHLEIKRNLDEEGHPASVCLSVYSTGLRRVWRKWKRFGTAAGRNVLGSVTHLEKGELSGSFFRCFRIYFLRFSKIKFTSATQA
jgi:hypothetical protein